MARRFFLLILAFGLIAFPTTALGQVLCPDGSYVSQGPCILCPDGSYVSASRGCQLAPDGSYLPARPGGVILGTEVCVGGRRIDR